MSDEARHAREPQCSFCGKHESEVDGMMAGPAAYICDECVALSFEVIGARKAERGVPWPPPGHSDQAAEPED